MPFDRPSRERAAFELGTSAAALRVRKLVEQSAASDLPVLITGEVGVGKDLIAREIHRRSARGDSSALLEINCAALSDDGELLHGALPARATLFLNGVGELSPLLQERLLALLRSTDGSAEGAVPAADLRTIAATHRDLAHAVEIGSFNEDLYYRLNLIHIHVPPLRARLEDVPALLLHFMREHGGLNGGGEPPESIRSRMLGYDWPGNLRELENTIRSFIALGDPTYVIEELDARTAERERSMRPPAHPHGSTYPPPSIAPDDDGYRIDLKKLGREASDAAERDAILAMLMHTMGNKKAAARRLGISYKALLYKIRDYGIADGHVGDVHVERGPEECGGSNTVVAAD